MVKLAAAGASKTPSPLSFYFSPEVFSRVDFSYLLYITPWLLSPVSIEFGSLSPSDSVNRDSYIMLPFTHSFIHSQIFTEHLSQALFNVLKTQEYSIQ